MTIGTLRILLLAAIALIAISVTAQPKPSGTDLQNQPRRIKSEPDNAFKQWTVDVEAIIAPAELLAWNKLQTNDEREKFISEFWRRRDPDLDTEENEYREAYYERVAYVNEHFASGMPGYKTDRGKIYLKYGKPDEVDSHPAGGSYERQPWEGGGSTSTYPFEHWWYRNLPGHSDVDFEFVDPTGTGEYRMARNPFEKDALRHVPGSTPMGINQADYVQAASGLGNPFSYRAKDSAFDWLETMTLRDKAPAVDFDRLHRSGTSTPVIEDNLLTSTVQISFFKQSTERVIVLFTVQTDNKDLVFRDLGGLQTARLNISGRITTVAEKRIGFFEDAVTTTASTSELISAKDRKSAYQKAVALPPGRYRVDVLVRDVESGAGSLQHLGFEVPKFGVGLASSSLIMASVLEQVSDVPASRQFMIGDRKIIPNLTGEYHRGSPIGVYMQIYNAGIDQTTLRPAVDVEYVLLRDRNEISRQTEDWRGNSDAGERLTLARLFDSRGLNPGDYSIEVRVRDRVSGQALVRSAKFTIAK